MQRPVFGRDDGRLVRPVLEQTALVPQQAVDELGIERTQPAEENQQVVAGDDRGGVELQTADRPDEVNDVISRDVFWAWSAQLLARNGQAPRMLDPNLPPAAQARDSRANAGSGTSQR